jgi:hypothetical protein
MSGYEETVEHSTQLFTEVGKLTRANSIDNKRDDDGDGVADVEQLESEKKFVELVSTVAFPLKEHAIIALFYSFTPPPQGISEDTRVYCCHRP